MMVSPLKISSEIILFEEDVIVEGLKYRLKMYAFSSRCQKYTI